MSITKTLFKKGPSLFTMINEATGLKTSSWLTIKMASLHAHSGEVG